MERKFNKQNVSDFIKSEIEHLENGFGFSEGDGNNVLNGEQDVTIAYGRYRALQDLHFSLFSEDKKFYS